jgi:ADP-heptose:LPS heptosyltransferase
LFFVGKDNLKLFNDGIFYKMDTLVGKSIFFGENNLSEVIINTLRRADIAAKKLYQKEPYLSSFTLFFQTLITLPFSFFKNLVISKGMREGFVGLVFSLFDSAMVFLCSLRYYEIYIRSGKHIEDNLNSVKKILVVKLRGLGDAVLATPVIKNINKLMPGVSVSVLTFNFCAPLFDNNPHLEKVYGLSGKPTRAEMSQLVRILNKEKFDLIINLHARNFSTKFSKKIRARWKISKSYFIRDKHSEISIGSDHSLDRSSVDRDLDCLRAIGLEPQDKTSEIFISNTEIQWAEAFMIKQNIDASKKLIIIHPTTNNSYTDWGVDRFVTLATQLINDHGHQVLACFPEKEQSISKTLLDKINGIFVHVGSLRQSISLISKADLMIDNCSAPSHISVALNIPTLVLMGADYSNIYRDKDIYNGSAFLFYKNVPCRDLFWSRCLPPDPCKNRVCLDHSVEDVLNKTLKVLST